MRIKIIIKTKISRKSQFEGRNMMEKKQSENNIFQLQFFLKTFFKPFKKSFVNLWRGKQNAG